MSRRPACCRDRRRLRGGKRGRLGECPIPWVGWCPAAHQDSTGPPAPPGVYPQAWCCRLLSERSGTSPRRCPHCRHAPVDSRRRQLPTSQCPAGIRPKPGPDEMRHRPWWRRRAFPRRGCPGWSMRHRRPPTSRQVRSDPCRRRPPAQACRWESRRRPLPYGSRCDHRRQRSRPERSGCCQVCWWMGPPRSRSRRWWRHLPASRCRCRRH
ncbi:hypothetical protein D3C86_1621910 [compost metagenome]